MRRRTEMRLGDSALLYRFELPFRSAAHLLGVSKQSGTTQLDPSGHTLEKVSLEGNYDSYFSLYAATDMKSDTQYVLDPAAMAFTVDFCQSHNWEIIGSELYFAQESRTSAPDDKTDMWGDVDEFIRQIRPAIELPSSDLNQSHNVPVGADRRKDIQCFECEELLTRIKGYFMCPAGHGVLLQGAKLPELRRGTLTIQLPELDATVATTTKKKCPSCDSSMNLVDYAGSNVLIETCSSCPYRWLDRADLVDIADQGAI